MDDAQVAPTTELIEKNDAVLGAVIPATSVGTPEDLGAYDVLLTEATRLTFKVVKSDRSAAATTLRVDTDRGVSALTMRINFDRKHPGKASQRNVEPYNSYVVDVCLGDGSESRVVQTVSCGGTSNRMSQKGMVSESMDRGDLLNLTIDQGGTCDPWASACLKCVAPEQVLLVERGRAMAGGGFQAGGGGTRLATTAAHNGATCRYVWCSALFGLPTSCVLPLCVSCCCAPPPTHYEVQGVDKVPLGGARYRVPHYTFCKEACWLRGLPDGATVDFGSAPLATRRDIVAAVALQIGSIAAVPDSA